jgi:hypothetical protein
MMTLLLGMIVVYLGLALAVMIGLRLGRSRATRVVAAALLSSGAAGFWAWLGALWFSSHREWALGGLLALVVLFFVCSVGPNMLGLALLAGMLARRGWLGGLVGRGVWIPVGAVYGLLVLAVSALSVFFGDPRVIVELRHVLFPPAILSGIAAVGLLTLFEARAAR